MVKILIDIFQTSESIISCRSSSLSQIQMIHVCSRISLSLSEQDVETRVGDTTCWRLLPHVLGGVVSAPLSCRVVVLFLHNNCIQKYFTL